MKTAKTFERKRPRDHPYEHLVSITQLSRFRLKINLGSDLDTNLEAQSRLLVLGAREVFEIVPKSFPYLYKSYSRPPRVLPAAPGAPRVLPTCQNGPPGCQNGSTSLPRIKALGTKNDWPFLLRNSAIAFKRIIQEPESQHTRQQRDLAKYKSKKTANQQAIKSSRIWQSMVAK